MEQEIQSQQIRLKNKLPLVVAVSILLTTLIVGAGAYFWQKSTLGKIENQILQLKNEYNVLKNQKTENINVPANSVSYNLINSVCTTEECLFNIGNSNHPLGTAIIKGYYLSVERSAWGETKTCDSFTITGGSKELIRAMVDLVDQGNNVHSKNQLNQPVINLGLELIGQSERQVIFNSSLNNQIELIVLNDSPVARGASTCFQDVIVLRIK